MSSILSKGERYNLTKELGILSNLAVGLGWQTTTTDYDIDVSVFMLGGNGQIPKEEYFIFYNNLHSPDNSVEHLGDSVKGGEFSDSETIHINLDKVSPEIEEIVFIVTIHEAEDKNQTFSQVKNAYIRIYTRPHNLELVRFNLQELTAGETAIEFGRLYKKAGEWRFRATGSGYTAGLQTFVDSYYSEGGKDSSTVQEAMLEQFRQKFIEHCSDDLLTEEEMQQLQQFAKANNISWNNALKFVRTDAVHLLERTVTFAAEDGVITEEEETSILKLKKDLAIPEKIARPILDRMEVVKKAARIREGHLPVAQSSVHLEPDETCHLETEAIYRKISTRKESLIQGRLVVTNRKINFLSPSGGWQIHWTNILRVERELASIYIELSAKKGNGWYIVEDPITCEAIIDTLSRIAKRQVLAPKQESNSRHIPQRVKIEVWQRDGGKCVECSAISYLEFDHIIPFSMGGANTVNNIQLLCRKCNLTKGDRL